jgi:hypothetical protein
MFLENFGRYLTSFYTIMHSYHPIFYTLYYNVFLLSYLLHFYTIMYSYYPISYTSFYTIMYFYYPFPFLYYHAFLLSYLLHFHPISCTSIPTSFHRFLSFHYPISYTFILSRIFIILSFTFLYYLIHFNKSTSSNSHPLFSIFIFLNAQLV